MTQKIFKTRKDGAIVSSNTSSIPIKVLSEHLTDTQKKDLEITYKNQSMILSFDKLDKPKKTISVTDKFTGEKKLLYYYDWIPVDPNQGRLL